MRPLLALLLVVAILGTVAGYMQFQSLSQVPPAAPREQAASAPYDLEITLTFTAEPDAFALDAGSSLLVRFRGQDLLRRTETVEPGEPVVIENVPNIVVGRNEFYVEATPESAGAPRAHALRLRILQAGETVADETLWSPAGEPVRGTLLLTVSEQESGTGDAHDHD